MNIRRAHPYQNEVNPAACERILLIGARAVYKHPGGFLVANATTDKITGLFNPNQEQEAKDNAVNNSMRD